MRLEKVGFWIVLVYDSDRFLFVKCVCVCVYEGIGGGSSDGAGNVFRIKEQVRIQEI